MRQNREKAVKFIIFVNTRRISTRIHSTLTFMPIHHTVEFQQFCNIFFHIFKQKKIQQTLQNQ